FTSVPGIVRPPAVNDTSSVAISCETSTVIALPTGSLGFSAVCDDDEHATRTSTSDRMRELSHEQRSEDRERRVPQDAGPQRARAIEQVTPHETRRLQP